MRSASTGALATQPGNLAPHFLRQRDRVVAQWLGTP